MSVAHKHTTRQVLPSRREQTREAIAIRVPRTRQAAVRDWLYTWRTGILWAMLLVGLSGLGLAMTRSSLFLLRQVEVVGCRTPVAEDIERLVRQQATGSLLTVSLADLRQNLESLPRVRHVQVIRILPDALRVVVKERQPFVLVHMAERSGLVWLDEEGVVIGVYEPDSDEEPPILAVGFASDRSASGRRENRERLQLYRNLTWALDAAAPRLSERIESVDLSHLQDVRVQLRDSRIVIGLGKEDFRERLLHACEIVDALQRRDKSILERMSFSDPRIFDKAPYLKTVNMVSARQVNLEFDERLPTLPSQTPTGAKRALSLPKAHPKPTSRPAGSPARR
ncbi:MAG: cell division protein FtsQ/DivIB [Acidobacteriota bacterium]